MIVFANADGSIAAYTPKRITQGSVEANEITLVGPFPGAVVTLAFTLPNGQVLGPRLSDRPEKLTMTEAFDNPYNVGEITLSAHTYKCKGELTSLSGKLGIQFFITVGKLNVTGADSSEVSGYTITTDMINVTVYNGTKYIPTVDLSDIDTISAILRYVAAANEAANTAANEASGAWSFANEAYGLATTSETAAKDAKDALKKAVLNESDTAQIIKSALTVLGELKGDSAEFSRIVGEFAEFDDLIIRGTATIVEQETVTTPENIIVTNSEGAAFSASGLVINTGLREHIGDDPETAVEKDIYFGILYHPYEGVLKIGKGTLTYADDEIKSNPEFTYLDGEALPLAARDGEFSEGVVPVWNASKNAFKPSDNLLDDTDVTVARSGVITEKDGQLATRDDIFSIISIFTSGEWMTHYSLDKAYPAFLADIKIDINAQKRYEAKNIVFELNESKEVNIYSETTDIVCFYKAKGVDLFVYENDKLIGRVTDATVIYQYATTYSDFRYLSVTADKEKEFFKDAVKFPYNDTSFTANLDSVVITKVKTTENLKSLVTTLTEIQSGGVI